MLHHPIKELVGWLLRVVVFVHKIVQLLELDIVGHLNGICFFFRLQKYGAVKVRHLVTRGGRHFSNYLLDLAQTLVVLLSHYLFIM